MHTRWEVLAFFEVAAIATFSWFEGARIVAAGAGPTRLMSHFLNDRCHFVVRLSSVSPKPFAILHVYCNDVLQFLQLWVIAQIQEAESHNKHSQQHLRPPVKGAESADAKVIYSHTPKYV